MYNYIIFPGLAVNRTFSSAKLPNDVAVIVLIAKALLVTLHRIRHFEFDN